MVDRATGIRVGLTGGKQVETEFRRLGTSGQQALQKIERAGRPASKSLLAVNAASREIQGGLRGFASRAGPAGNLLAGLGPAGLAAAAGIGASVIALQRIAVESRKAVEELDDIGKTADNIGVTTDALQELRFAGERMGVEVSQVDSGLESFAKRLGELRAGTGSLTTFLNRTDPAFRDLLSNATSNDEALELLLDRMADTTDQADRLALSAAAFGRGPGVDMARIVRDGSDALAGLRDEARELGVVIDESLIRKAEETSDKLTNVETIINANMNQAFVNMSGLLEASTGLWLSLSEAIRGVSDALLEIEQRSTAGLIKDIGDLQDTIIELSDDLATARTDIELTGILGGATISSENLEVQIAEAREKLERTVLELERRELQRERRASRGPGLPTTETGGGAATGTDKFAQQLDALKAQLDPAGAALTEYRTNFDILTRAVDEGLITGAQYQTLQAALNREFVEASSEAEKAAKANKGLSDSQKALQRSAQSLIAGARTEAERLEAQIETLRQAIGEDLVADTDAAEEALKRLEEQLARSGEEIGVVDRELNRAADGGIRRISEDLARGEASWQSFGNIVLDTIEAINTALIELAIRSALGLGPPGGGAGGGGGLFGLALGGLSLFGGGGGAGSAAAVPGPHLAKGGVFERGRLTAFQDGGIIDRPTLFPMANGGMGLAGERGDEAILPLDRLADGRLGVAATGGATVVRPEVRLTVINETGTPVQAEARQAPNGDIELMLSKAVAGDIDRGGPTFKAIERNFQTRARTFG